MTEASGSWELPPWTGICQRCRLVLAAGERCPEEGHRTLDLADRHQLARLRPGLDQPSTRSDEAGRYTALSFSYFAVPCSLGAAYLVYTGRFQLGMILGLVAVGAIAGMGSTRLRKRTPLGPPRGTTWRPRDDQPVPGTVRAKAKIPSPLSGRACAGFVVELRGVRVKPGPLTASIGRCRELEVDLDDGRTVVIPEGPIHAMDLPATEAPAERVESLHEQIFPGDAHDRSPFRRSQVAELTVADGDRVALYGRLQPSEESGYRDSSHRYQFVGVPCLGPVEPRSENA